MVLHNNYLRRCFGFVFIVVLQVARVCLANSWTKVGNDAVYTPSTQNSYYEAVSYCNNIGGDIVNISSSQENSNVRQFALDQGLDNYWIGLNDIANEGTWVNEDGSNPTYLYWESGEPNNVGNEDCAEVRVSGGFWNDVTCSTRADSICEKKTTCGCESPGTSFCYDFNASTCASCTGIDYVFNCTGLNLGPDEYDNCVRCFIVKTHHDCPRLKVWCIDFVRPELVSIVPAEECHEF